jgi:hypothetical protein
MALSATSLEINEITTELLFSRGTLFESGQVYIPQYSSIGTTVYGTWNVLHISTAFSNDLYGYSNIPSLLSSVNYILYQNNLISTSLQLNVNVLSTVTASSFCTLAVLQAFGPSTIAQFQINLNSDAATASNRYSTTLALPAQLSSMSTNVAPSVFMSSLYNQNSTNIVNLAYFYYTPSTNTQGIASRYIGPGVSSLYSSLKQGTISTNVFSSFLGILSNTSTTLSSVNSTVIGNLSLAKTYVLASSNLIENFSSVSSSYASSFQSFQCTLSTTTYAQDVSSFSTYVLTTLNSYSVLNLGPSISSFNDFTFINDIPMYENQSISSLQSVNLLAGSISTMSTYIQSSILSSYTSFSYVNNISGICTLNTLLVYSFPPAFNIFSVSSTQIGYQTLTSTALSSFSTFSTLFPTYLASNILAGFQSNTSNVCSFSTQISVQASSLTELTYPFITGGGVSSIYQTLQSTVATTSGLYSTQMSTISGNFNVSFVRTNPVSGLSSLASSATSVFSTIAIQSSTIDTYVNFTYLSEINSIYYGQTGFINTISTIGSNQSSFLSTVGFINVVIGQCSTLSTVTVNNMNYISTMNAYPNGYLYTQIYLQSSFNKSTILLVNPYIGSTSFFYQLTFPVNYSTIFSANLYNMTTSSINNVSFVKTNSLFIQQPLSSIFSVDVVGGVLIQPYSYTSSIFLVGNSNPWIYTFGFSTGIATYSTNSSYIYRLADATVAINAYGLGLADSAVTLAMQGNTHFFYDTYGQIKSIPISSQLTSYDFLSQTGNGLINSNVPMSYFTLNNTSLFSQVSSVINSNVLITYGGIGTSTNIKVHTFSSVTNAGVNFKSMGPMTSITTNGQVYLMTAMSNVAYSYQTSWYQPASITNSTFYTMFLANSLYPGTLSNTQFSTMIGPELSNPTEIYDAVWAGKTWVIVGDGAFVSQDNYTWTRTLPSTTERILRYRSVDYNGKDIIAAQISSIPNYVALLKSQDFGYTWSQISTIKLSVYANAYTDYISTGLYSVKIKWAYNSWNLFALPTQLGAVSAQANQAFYQSFDGGTTWSSNAMTNTTNIDSNTMAVLFEPFQQLQPSIQLPNINIWTRDDPNKIYFGHSMAARFSTITFNEGDLTFLKNTQNSLLRGYVGINTLNPQYSLDIGYGNARQPNSTTWINPSDKRIKQIVSSISDEKLLSNLSSLRLVSFKWESRYRDEHRLPEDREIGFISQEVSKILPSSIYFTNEFGVPSFQTLDTDQLFKMKFGATQVLLKRMASLQDRISAIKVKIALNGL